MTDVDMKGFGKVETFKLKERFKKCYVFLRSAISCICLLQSQGFAFSVPFNVIKMVRLLS